MHQLSLCINNLQILVFALVTQCLKSNMIPCKYLETFRPIPGIKIKVVIAILVGEESQNTLLRVF